MSEQEGLKDEQDISYGIQSQSTSNASSSSSEWLRWAPTLSVGKNVADDVDDISTSNPFSSGSELNRNSNLVDVRAPICPRLPSCKVSCYERFPRRKELFLILALLTIGRYVLYGAIDEIQHVILGPDDDSRTTTTLRAFLRFFLLYGISHIFYPVGGFVADVYLGRYRVIHISLWFSWIAFALLAISRVLSGQDHSDHLKIIHHYILPILAYIMTLLASGGFEPTLIPFGADQLEAAGSNEISAYFYWYCFVIHIGEALNLGVNIFLETWLPIETANLVKVMIAIVVTTLGLILHKTLEHWYIKSIVRENCLKLVAKVLWYAATVKRQMPRYRRAFRYGEGRISRINLAKQRYDGKFTSEKVEDVKTFCRLCLVIICLFGTIFSMAGGNAMMSYRVNATLLTVSNGSYAVFVHSISPSTFLIVNIITMLVFTPLVNHILVPCLPFISIKARMAMGMVLNIAGVIATGLIEIYVHKPLNLLLLYLIPTVLITLPSVLTIVSGLEFVYAQAPESMKGMLIGLFFLNLGLSSGGSTLLLFWFLSSSYDSDYYYWMLLGAAIISLVIYTIVACLYVNRKRPRAESEDTDDTRQIYNNLTIR